MGRRSAFVPGGPLQPPIALLIDTYAPRAMAADEWESVAEDVRSWTRVASPGVREVAKRFLLNSARLALWARSQRLPLDPALLFTPDILDRYVDYVAERSERTHAADVRAVLRRFAPVLAAPGSYAVPSRQIPASTVAPPLSHNVELALLASARTHGPQMAGFVAALPGILDAAGEAHA